MPIRESPCEIPYSKKRVRIKCPPDPDENVWGADEKWILQFDNIIKHPGGRAKGCKCEIHSPGRYDDETDRPVVRTVAKKLGAKKPPANPLTSTLVAGAVDEDYFANVFEEVPTVQIFSAQELKEQVNGIATIISNTDADWDKRVDAFKRIRSLVIAGAATYDDFNDLIKKWELPFVESLKDLRSQVVREACVTIAYLAQAMGNKFGHVAEIVFPSLSALIQSSAKVFASAAFTAIRFIIQNVHNQRLIPIINNNLTSKSREIRKAMCDVLDQLLHTWPLPILDRRIPLLQEAVRRGVSDADNEARASARRAFWAFKGYFPEQADALLATLDNSYKRNLYGDVSLSGSNQSLNMGSLTRPATASSRNRGPGSGSVSGSAENLHNAHQSGSHHLHRTPSIPRSRKSGIPVKTQNSAVGQRSLTPRPRSPPDIFAESVKPELTSSISASTYSSPYSLRNRDRSNLSRHERNASSVSPPPSRRKYAISVVVPNPFANAVPQGRVLDAETTRKKRTEWSSGKLTEEDDPEADLIEEISCALESVIEDNLTRPRIPKSVFIQKRSPNEAVVEAEETGHNVAGDCKQFSDATNKIVETIMTTTTTTTTTATTTATNSPSPSPMKEITLHLNTSDEEISFLKFPPKKEQSSKEVDELDNGVIILLPPRSSKKRNRKKYTKIVEKTVIKQTTAFREFYLSPNGLRRRSRKFSRVSHDEVLDIRRVKLLEKGTMTETMFESSIESTVFKEHVRKRAGKTEREYTLKRAPKVTCFSLMSPRSPRKDDHEISAAAAAAAATSDKGKPSMEIVRSPHKYSGRYLCSFSMLKQDEAERKIIDPFWRKKDFFKINEEISENILEDVLHSSGSSNFTPRDVCNGLNIATPIIRIPINKDLRKPYRDPPKSRGRCPVCKKFLQEDLSDKWPISFEVDTCPACGTSYYETELGELIDENYVRKNPDLFEIVQPSTLSEEYLAQQWCHWYFRNLKERENRLRGERPKPLPLPPIEFPTIVADNILGESLKTKVADFLLLNKECDALTAGATLGDGSCPGCGSKIARSATVSDPHYRHHRHRHRHHSPVCPPKTSSHHREPHNPPGTGSFSGIVARRERRRKGSRGKRTQTDMCRADELKQCER